MNAQPIARVPDGVVHNRQRREPPKLEARTQSPNHDKLKSCPNKGTLPVLGNAHVDSPDQPPGYVSEESYVRLASKRSELESRVKQLYEQNRRQTHQIETLEGSHWGTEEGIKQLHARIAELEEMLSKAEIQMAHCTDLRDQWQANYEAQIGVKHEESKTLNRMKAENQDLRNEQSHWSKLFQQVTFRSQSEAAAQQQLSEKCDKFEYEYLKLVHRYDQREVEFTEQVKKLNSTIDELTAHGNRLAKQSGLRRTYVPIEDESEVIGVFRQLNVAVRYWCLAAWDLKIKDAEVRFGHFPLARRNDVHFATDDVWLLIACVWEWLMKDVFGIANRSQKVFDLWMDEEIAEALSVLESRVAAMQSKVFMPNLEPH